MAVLVKDYLKQYNTDPLPSATDKEIRRIIDTNPSEDYDEVISNEDCWEIFEQLSQLRTSVLNWYEFKQDSRLLELGGECGALTGTFCDRCSDVTVVESNPFRAETISRRYKNRENLTIIEGDIENIPFTEKYDYIIMVGYLEKVGKGATDKSVYADFLKKVRTLLKPGGKVLLAVENRYGVRYFCGAREPYTGKPFEGINKYLRGTTGYTFSKQELIDILNAAELSHHKFYYPLPDYKVSQMIYSDSYLPEKNLQERLLPYYTKVESLLALEHNLYDDLIDNNVFPFFANSFLVECADQENFCSVIYATVSTDRGREFGFATTIHSDQSVRKATLNKEGTEHLRQIHENNQELIARGVPVLSQKIDNNSLIMPYINAKTLSAHIRDLEIKDKEHLIELFDSLYEIILASSEAVPSEQNALITEHTKNLEWGVILRKASIELIPLNCFYTDGALLFFDQEFTKANYPAKYIMFRALHYVYAFAPNTEAIIQKQKLFDKYGLTDLEELFRKEENRFLKEIRRQRVYNQFNRWTNMGEHRIFQNVDMLAYKGESLLEYETTPRLKQLQDVQKRLLMTLKDICDRNHLNYFIFYGTLLGAIRHEGFIPWDDDVDIVLPREDYNKLVKIAAIELEAPYYLQTPENDPGCFYGGYAKLRNNETTGIEIVNWNKECNHGIWIDIFPLDSCYHDDIQNEKKYKKICYYQRLLYAKTYTSEIRFKDMKPIVWNLYRVLTKFYKRKILINKLEETFQEGDHNSKYVGIFTHYNAGAGVKFLFREDFNSRTFVTFEHCKLPAPIGYQRCLEISMGKNYLRYPAIEDRKPHHQAFFAPNVPFLAYIHRFHDIFKEVQDKQIVLFGAGHMFEDYMQKYGKVYPPQFLVDNNPNKWGTDKQGIPILKPEELLKVDRNRLHLIICNIYYRNIEEQLKTMGITDYYIYVQEKEWLTSDPL